MVHEIFVESDISLVETFNKFLNSAYSFFDIPSTNITFESNRYVGYDARFLLTTKEIRINCYFLSSLERVLISLTHELIHYRDFFNKDLMFDLHGNRIYFKGLWYNKRPIHLYSLDEYQNLPWEIEPYQKSKNYAIDILSKSTFSKEELELFSTKILKIEPKNPRINQNLKIADMIMKEQLQ